MRNPKLLAAVFDFGMATAGFILMPLLFILARPMRHLPITRKLLEHYDVALMRHHYYSPVVFPSESQFRWDIANSPLPQLEVLGEKGRPSIQVTFVAPDKNDPRFRDDDVIEQPPSHLSRRSTIRSYCLHPLSPQCRRSSGGSRAIGWTSVPLGSRR
jgi:hypothetical protein